MLDCYHHHYYDNDSNDNYDVDHDYNDNSDDKEDNEGICYNRNPEDIESQLIMIMSDIIVLRAMQ